MSALNKELATPAESSQPEHISAAEVERLRRVERAATRLYDLIFCYDDGGLYIGNEAEDGSEPGRDAIEELEQALGLAQNGR